VGHLQEALKQHIPHFGYPLDINIVRGNSADEGVILCCHGYGSDRSIANVISSYRVVKEHLVGFNFPDYQINNRRFDYQKVCYGTPYELLPALCILKAIVVDAKVNQVSLYGFSTGGGAVVNIVAALNTNRFDSLLQRWGIQASDKSTILSALQKGVILLDAPLKSKEEISDAKGHNSASDFLTKRYRDNQMRPLDALADWKGLRLSVVLFFQNPDTSLTNRDDHLFAQRLLKYNPEGRNKVIIANEGGHCGFHLSLWKTFNALIAETQVSDKALLHNSTVRNSDAATPATTDF
jgi:hypothetical protein